MVDDGDILISFYESECFKIYSFLGHLYNLRTRHCTAHVKTSLFVKGIN